MPAFLLRNCFQPMTRTISNMLSSPSLWEGLREDLLPSYWEGLGEGLTSPPSGRG